jgi:hypothetical protein
MGSTTASRLGAWLALLFAAAGAGAAEKRATIDFNRDVRPILSNACFRCHGPDEKERQGKRGGLRLDAAESAFADRGGYAAIAPGRPEASELLRRVRADDASERMPPEGSGKALSAAEIATLEEWIRQGAGYARHWSYVAPARPPVPASAPEDWGENEIDAFILARLRREGLAPSPEADRFTLIRRAALDLTGLPPSLEEVERFAADDSPEAYERLVERLLEKPSFGEHWARMWLDLARYADSAGYADDPARTIWAYRDYVIRAFNDNKPFDRFTLEQLAGDLLPEAGEEDLIATAFHRNTLTNNEGGTSDEEFRNVAVVDRVNTTLAVWMGTTIHCCQCHSHKYDPITQEEFYRLFAFFNTSADADRPDESPLLEIWSKEQKDEKAALAEEIAALKAALAASSPERLAAAARWEERLAAEPSWRTLKPDAAASKSGAAAAIGDDGTVFVSEPRKTDVLTLRLPLDGLPAAAGGAAALTALRLEALPHPELPKNGPGHGGGNFVVTRVAASLSPPPASRPSGRYVRVALPGKGKFLSLAEVEVFSEGENVARRGAASQQSTDFGGPAELAIDGNTSGDYAAGSTTHTALADDPWWELDLKSERPIERIVVWNRVDSGLHVRLKDFRVEVLGADRGTRWQSKFAEAPNPSVEMTPGGPRAVPLAAAYAEFSQKGFEARHVLAEKSAGDKGWAIGPRVGEPHALTLIPASPLEAPPGSVLELTIEQLSKHENHTLGRFRVAASGDAGVSEYARTPPAILGILKSPAAERSEAARGEVLRHYLSIAPELEADRQRLGSLERRQSAMKPATTVPVMRELPPSQRRSTRVQIRGNFLDLGAEVSEGVPAVFHPLPAEAPRDRLALARWLVDPSNPLTARVMVNRFWEAIFGVGLVRTSEEFGSQGELPSHPELLDWLALEFVEKGWNVKGLLRLMASSAAYRQSSRVTPESFERDPENRLLARGPRIRLSAEMVRDQALFVAGLLSPKMHGPPVKPPQPSLGLSAAFGSGIDWEASQGEDRYRRGLYTTWRRSNPYPSMAAFDAPNREVCTLARTRTNTPLQALVTLNDPVYVEAAQALARRALTSRGEAPEIARHAFRLCLARPPSADELASLLALHDSALERLAAEPEKAARLASVPLGALPEGIGAADAAAWTVVANVLLNLDEMFLKR